MVYDDLIQKKHGALYWAEPGERRYPWPFFHTFSDWMKELVLAAQFRPMPSHLPCS